MNTRRSIPAAATLGAALTVISCATIEQLAPPVDGLVLRQATLEQLPPESLRGGRSIYITQCAQCHRPEPIGRYTEGQWKKILPRMGGQTTISAAQAADLEQYVMVTRRAMVDDAGEEKARDE